MILFHYKSVFSSVRPKTPTNWHSVYGCKYNSKLKNPTENQCKYSSEYIWLMSAIFHRELFLVAKLSYRTSKFIELGENIRNRECFPVNGIPIKI